MPAYAYRQILQSFRGKALLDASSRFAAWIIFYSPSLCQTPVRQIKRRPLLDRRFGSYEKSDHYTMLLAR
ncbi:MAG TPA: hypothetical protein VLA51_07510, partial [Paracoccaceae bacterium]|nr:hypothetical protein [Paracoccaceae bacterium]